MHELGQAGAYGRSLLTEAKKKVKKPDAAAMAVGAAQIMSCGDSIMMIPTAAFAVSLECGVSSSKNV